MTGGIEFPKSEAIVNVRVFDTTTKLSFRANYIVSPVLEGHERFNLTTVAFLIEHPKSGQKVLFDLGSRKDYWNHSPTVLARMGRACAGLHVEKGADEVLRDVGVDLDQISAIVLSHHHFDHSGDPSRFPAHSKLVVGPGFRKSWMPGFPSSPDGYLLDTCFEGREVFEVDFRNENLHIGGFPAYDFFCDGSFYLLDTPGHSIGHLCGLARTSQDDYIFMGGDICHFAGCFRPNTTLRLPQQLALTESGLDPRNFPSPCPCSLFTACHPEKNPEIARQTPFYTLSNDEHSAYIDPSRALKDVENLGVFDRDDRVLVCLAHDPTLLCILPTMNSDPKSTLNGWRARGWKQKSNWGFLNELPRGGKPGRPALIEGFTRDI